MSKESIRHTQVKIEERSKITLDGVNHIVSFDDGYVALDIGGYRLSVEGEGLKIESLSQESGEIIITGKVDGVFYSKEKKVRGGLWRLLG